MPEKSKKFHEFALKSILFKGQHDLYFCYIKAEKIAHVLSVLQSRSVGQDAEHMDRLVSGASRLPETITHFAAGELELGVLLADIFSLLSASRIAATQGFLHKENASIIAEEYEHLAERLTGGGRLSPFVSPDDFMLPQLPVDDTPTPFSLHGSLVQSDISLKDSKGQEQGQPKTTVSGSKGHSSAAEKRAALVLGFVRKNPNASIKDIAKVVKDCSEKTIQRELTLLIQQGLVEKRGERRWTVYFPI